MQGLNQSLVVVEMMKEDRNTRDNLVWTAGNGGPMQEICMTHRIPRAQGLNKGKKQIPG